MLDKISGVITARIHDENDHSDEEGFTLIELLIVVIVLGILAAVTVFGLSGASGQSAVAACKSDARTTEVAVDAYHAQSPNGTWPTAPTDLTVPGINNSTGIATGWGGAGQPPLPAPFLRSLPGNSPHYTIQLIPSTSPAGGEDVQVTPSNGKPAGDFDTSTPNVCESVT
jgi:prepilin-type N-terminal cleavage/methylation domain-containing protein